MKPPADSSSSQEQRLCLACGLCCDGVLFKDVELQESDDPARYSALGLPLQVRRDRRDGRSGAAGSRTIISSPQPCAALLGCRCTLYPARPTQCRQFDCALLLRLRRGELEEAEALRCIQETRQRAQSVLRLFRELGDPDDSQALSLRFQRIRRRMQQTAALDEEQAEVYARLTLAVHDLQQNLRRMFYA